MLRGSDKPLAFYLLGTWFLLNDKVVFCPTFKMSLDYEWVEGFWAPFTNKIFACVACGRTCFLVGFKKVGWGVWINWFFERSTLQLVWFCFHSAGKIVSSLNCAWPHLLSFCYLGPWSRFFSSSTSQILVYVMQEVIPSVEIGIWQLPPELCTLLWQAACCFPVPGYLNEDFRLHRLVIMRLFAWIAPLKWGVR